MNRFILGTIALMLTVVVAGCNTFQGMGQDIQSAGQSIQKAATPKNGNNN
jgi:predicted small secreted protein